MSPKLCLIVGCPTSDNEHPTMNKKNSPKSGVGVFYIRLFYPILYFYLISGSVSDNYLEDNYNQNNREENRDPFSANLAENGSLLFLFGDNDYRCSEWKVEISQ